jgi:hypothetical protein
MFLYGGLSMLMGQALRIYTQVVDYMGVTKRQSYYAKR